MWPEDWWQIPEGEARLFELKERVVRTYKLLHILRRTGITDFSTGNGISLNGAATSKQENYRIRVYSGPPGAEPRFKGTVYNKVCFCYVDRHRSKTPYEALKRLYEWSKAELLCREEGGEESEGEDSIMEEEPSEEKKETREEWILHEGSSGEEEGSKDRWTVEEESSEEEGSSGEEESITRAKKEATAKWAEDDA